MKRMFSLLIVMAIVLSAGGVAALAQPITDDVSPYYTNASLASASATVNDTGLISVDVRCYGKSGTSMIEATTYLEYKTGWSWARIANGQPNHQWEVSQESSALRENYTYQLQASGTYRATTVFKVTTNGVTETIVVHSEEVSRST